MKDIAIRTMKIDQSIFIKDLIIKKKLTEYNVNVILMKTRLIIKIIKLNDYEKTKIHKY